MKLKSLGLLWAFALAVLIIPVAPRGDGGVRDIEVPPPTTPVQNRVFADIEVPPPTTPVSNRVFADIEVPPPTTPAA